MEINMNRRRSSVFPQYLRRNTERKDSIFASESTNNLFPYTIDDKEINLNNYLNQSQNGLKFGWINGVYIRTVLNIFGVMLFIRMGWITGNAGIVISLGIVLISTLLTFCTTLSMSAICTNGEIGTGGIYYMISRSLGAEAGSMIGIIFSLANAVLVSLNLVGAGETTVRIFNIFSITIFDEHNDARIYSTILLFIIAIVPLIGMDWEAKAMFFLLIVLLIGLLNYAIGTVLPLTAIQISRGNIGWQGKALAANLWGQWNSNLAEIFSVFFPSVIGIFAGASMSGDLRDPNAAIPKGTFLAIITTSLVYAILVIFLGSTILPFASGDFEEMLNLTNPLDLSCYRQNNCSFGLVNDYQTVALSSWYEPLIYAGIYAATLSSALGSYVCAPRIFQALCEDKLFPYIHFFAKGYGPNNDPRRGYVLTFLIAWIFLLIGQVNSIAPIISNFFIASFCLVNITCFHASFVGSPSFRPTFKYYNKWISLLTGLVCIVIMFFLDWISAIITVVLMVLIYFYISKKGPEVNWGTSTKGHVYNNALFSALKLNQTKDHVKNFRPSILLLTGNPSARIPLVEFANNITYNRSLLMLGHIINYEIPFFTRNKVIQSQYEWMAKRKIKAFYLLLEASSLTQGAKAMFQVSGLGTKLSPNIVMLGYKSSWKNCLLDDLLDYYNVIITAYETFMGVIILRVQEGLDFSDFFGPSFFKPIVPKSIETSANGDVPQHLESILEMKESKSEKFSGDSEASHPLKPFAMTMNVTKTPTNGFKNNFDQMKKLIPMDAMEAINQFSLKQKSGHIDIWWLTEDGGLIVLIPYLLHISYNWSACSIRIFCLTKTTENIEETKQNMTELVKRLRIPYKDIVVISEVEFKPSEQSKDRFKSFLRDFMCKNETHSESKHPVRANKIDLIKFEEKTNKYLILRDLMLMHSKTSTLIVMTLPLPHRLIVASLYMSWLETITEDMPPFLFVRGHKDVLTV